jgi:SsrA-binding protein
MTRASAGRLPGSRRRPASARGCPPRLVGVAGEKLIVDNRRARHDYALLERFEAGLVLTGTEVKSLRAGRISLAQAFAELRDGEVWLVGADIAVYDQGNIANHEPGRDRKLLLRRGEIASLHGKVREKGLTLVPTRMYWKNGRAKVELALARGKQTIDKRRDIARREADRAIQRALKARR